MITNCLSKQWSTVMDFALEDAAAKSNGLTVKISDFARSWDCSLTAAYKASKMFNAYEGAIRRVSGFVHASKIDDHDSLYKYYQGKLYTTDNQLIVPYWFNQRDHLLGVICVAIGISSVYTDHIENLRQDPQEELWIDIVNYYKKWIYLSVRDRQEINLRQHKQLASV